MGAVKLDINTGATVANNSNYSGGAVNTSPKPTFNSSTIVDGLKNSIASRAVGVAVRTAIPRLNPYLGIASIAYEGAKLAYEKYQDDNLPSMSVVKILNSKADDEIDVQTSAQNFSDYQETQLSQLGISLDEINTNLTASTAPTLPETMINNTSALVQSLNALTLSFQENLGYVASGIFGISAYLEQLVSLKQTQLDFNEQVEAIKLEKTELQKEHYEYKKTSQAINDLDGEVVANLSPREAEMIKNATVAKETTDKNNLDFDEEFEFFPDIDISKIFTYESYSEIYKQVINENGGNL